MSETISKRKISKIKNSENSTNTTLTILEHDSKYFHVRIGDYTTISGMTKTEILDVEGKYKGSFKIIFKTKTLEKMFKTHIDDPQFS